MQFENIFTLSAQRDIGICCDERGLFFNGLALLARENTEKNRVRWRPKAIPDLNIELSKALRMPVDLGTRTDGLKSIAGAMNRNDIAHAQIAALLLRLPTLAKGLEVGRPDKKSQEEFEAALNAEGLLKADWDPMKHPRWPAGANGGVGGQFAPLDDATEAPGGATSTIPAQLTLPAPSIEIPDPIPLPVPLPSEIVPPINAPVVLPRSLPQNPYPDRPECVREWQDAYQFCWGLKSRGLLGRGDYRGMGRTLRNCIMGQVSESCGGNAGFI